MAVDKLHCPICGFPVREKDSVCGNCGEALSNAPTIPDMVREEPVIPQPKTSSPASVRCPECSHANPATNKFCSECGASLSQKPLSNAHLEKGKQAKHAQSKKKSNAKAQPGTRWKFSHFAYVFLAIFGLVLIIIFSNERDTKKDRSEVVTNSQTPSVDLAAVDEAQKYVDANPKDAQGILRLANILHDSHLLDRAITEYQRYLALTPDDPNARVDLGICYYEQQKFPDALREMSRVAKAHPDHQLARFNLGIVNLAAGNNADARRWLEESIKINPSAEVAEQAKALLKKANEAPPAQ